MPTPAQQQDLDLQQVTKAVMSSQASTCSCVESLWWSLCNLFRLIFIFALCRRLCVQSASCNTLLFLNNDSNAAGNWDNAIQVIVRRNEKVQKTLWLNTLASTRTVPWVFAVVFCSNKLNLKKVLAEAWTSLALQCWVFLTEEKTKEIGSQHPRVLECP